MNEEERLAQDLAQATDTYPDAVGILLSQADTWDKQMELIQTGRYKEAMASIENSIANIEGYLAKLPSAKGVLEFTLARAYANKGTCIFIHAGQTTDINRAKQGIQWIDKALAPTNLPSDFDNRYRQMRAKVVSQIPKTEGKPSTANSNTSASRTSAKPRTQSFNEVSAICPTCGKQSTIRLHGKCSGACTYDMDEFESGNGLFCVVCGIGFYAKDIEGKGAGVLHCGARIYGSGTSVSVSVECREPIPATPNCITPKPSDKGCLPIVVLLLLLPMSFILVLYYG